MTPNGDPDGEGAPHGSATTAGSPPQPEAGSVPAASRVGVGAVGVSRPCVHHHLPPPNPGWWDGVTACEPRRGRWHGMSLRSAMGRTETSPRTCGAEWGEKGKLRQPSHYSLTPAQGWSGVLTLARLQADPPARCGTEGTGSGDPPPGLGGAVPGHPSGAKAAWGRSSRHWAGTQLHTGIQ